MINRGSLGPSHGDSRASTPRLAVIVIAAALSGLVATRAHAQSDPPSQDDQLRSQLGLGDNKGCFNLLGLPNTNTTPVDQTLRNLGPQIGNELRAICGSSQVNSASSQGGALNTLQATKTVAQFRLVRRRIDQRLQPGRGAKPTRELLFGFQQQAPSPSTTLGRELAGGIGLFGELEFEQRDRVNTVYESGYESDRNGFSVGLDYLAGKGVVGAWIGRSHQDANLTGSGVLIASPFPNSTEDAAFRELVDDPEVLAAVCGGSPEPGTFEQDGTRVGGFAGWGIGGAGFIDGTISYARRSHDYSRGLCAIENQGSPAFLTDVIFTDLNSNGTRDAGELQPAIGRGILFSDDGDGVLEQFESVFDDIFAGTLSGSTRHSRDQFLVPRRRRPRRWQLEHRPARHVDLHKRGNRHLRRDRQQVLRTIRCARTTALTSSAHWAGQSASSSHTTSSRAGRFCSRPVPRSRIASPRRLAPSSPTSAATGAMSSMTICSSSPFAWRRIRGRTPKRFTFATDGPDADTMLFGFGASAVVGEHLAARFEFSQLAYDDLYDSSVITIQARWRF